MPSLSDTDRFSRQQDLVPLDSLRNRAVSVIGVGAIGRQVALQLAAMGVRKLQLIDFDRVEPTNRTTQGYRAEDVGQLKVDATAEAVLGINPEIELDLWRQRYRPTIRLGSVVFCCVDSIGARTAIWRHAKLTADFWVDGRMRGEVLRILTAMERERSSHQHYEDSLFGQSEAQEGSCTAHSTLYAASVAAGLMVGQYVKWLRGNAVEYDLSLNMLAAEISVSG